MTDHYSGFTWGGTWKDKVADNLVNWAFTIIMAGIVIYVIFLYDCN